MGEQRSTKPLAKFKGFIQGTLKTLLEFHAPSDPFLEGLGKQVEDLQDQRDNLRNIRKSEVPFETQISFKTLDIAVLQVKLDLHQS